MPAVRSLCVGRGFSCDCDPKEIVQLFVLNGTPEGNLQKCPNCRGTARQFPSVLREFGTGEDAATAILAETLLRQLPQEQENKPAFGRRLLAFSDSRQRAAYFAPYLQRTMGETQVMTPLVAAIEKALRADPNGAPFSEIAFHFGKLVERQPFVIVRDALDEEGEEFAVTIKAGGDLNATDRAHLRRDCNVALLRHFAAQGRRRDTLPGLAIAAVAVDLTSNAKAQLEVLTGTLGLRSEKRRPSCSISSVSWCDAARWICHRMSLRECLGLGPCRQRCIALTPEGFREDASPLELLSGTSRGRKRGAAKSSSGRPRGSSEGGPG